MPEPDESASVREVLAAAVTALGGEERPGQVAMAEAVADAMDDGQHLLVQAGTGTGKSLGYLVPAPAPRQAGRRRDRDARAPAPARRARHPAAGRGGRRPGVDASYAVLKGRSNYACLHRIREGVPDDQGTLVDVPVGLDGPEGARAARLGRGGGRGQAAAASATARPRHTDREWRQVSVGHRDCLGAAKCPFGAECFVELAREKAQRSHLIVTNHSLLAIDAIEGVPMIPEYDVVVIDEAHELVARVTQAATDELGVSDVERAAKRSQRHVDGPEADDLADAGRRAGRRDRGRLARAASTPCPSSSADALVLVRDAARACLSAYPKDERAAATPTPAAPRPRGRSRRSSSTPSGWPPTSSPTCSG